VEKLGTLSEIKARYPDQDPYEWAGKYIKKLNDEERVNNREILLRCSPGKILNKNKVQLFSGGYLFLRQIYHELGGTAICHELKRRRRLTYDLDKILQCLIYGRILHPSSKSATYRFAKTLLEPADFDLQHEYRALEVLAEENDYIQSALYQNSKRGIARNDRILYYDCTNFFFEIEREDQLRRYGVSKEHRPNPIVQMGLFMDADGIPLAFDINPGNTNEQTTLGPLEKKILSDFGHSKFVICTDAGLSSYANRRFNNVQNRAFITTQPIKTLKGHLQSWVTDTKGWRLAADGLEYDISDIDEERHFESVFYKDRWIKENDIEQRLIVTYSPKYRAYQRKIRGAHIERALTLVDQHPERLGKARQNDYRRLISRTSTTKDGEIADRTKYSLNEGLIAAEEIYDGFYGVCTNLEDDASTIAAVNRRRWEVEECFRIMKHEFKARPVYLSRQDRIKAHFMTCFMALMVYRLLEKRLKGKYPCGEIIHCLKSMNFYRVDGEGYIPVYTRNDITDALHEAFEFRTDYQVITERQLKRIIKSTAKE
jgi:transposase